MLLECSRLGYFSARSFDDSTFVAAVAFWGLWTGVWSRRLQRAVDALLGGASDARDLDAE